ncbi:MAG: putative NAD-dependent epimerase/dehydratase family protein, partial [Bacteroidia bacterium]
MTKILDGNALVYSEGAFNTPNGKTAHGLVRFTDRYKVLGVIDSKYAGQDAGEVLDGKKSGIPIFTNLTEALKANENVQYFVMGLAPDGGRLPYKARRDVYEAVEKELNVDSGLHDFLYKDKELVALAIENGCELRDIRRTPERDKLHFFTGKIEEVNCLKLAILGTDSAVGKRTTAWIVVHGLRNAGKKAEMIVTGQTGWMQGA